MVLEDDEVLDELVLDFLEDNDEWTPEYVDKRVSAALEEFDFDEILDENNISPEEVLGILFEQGYIGLPEYLEYEDDGAEVEGL